MDKFWKSVIGSAQIDKLEGSLYCYGQYFFIGSKTRPTAVFLRLPNTWKLSIPRPVVFDLWLRGRNAEICEGIWAMKPNHNEHEISGTLFVPTEIIYFKAHFFFEQKLFLFCFFHYKKPSSTGECLESLVQNQTQI